MIELLFLTAGAVACAVDYLKNQEIKAKNYKDPRTKQTYHDGRGNEFFNGNQVITVNKMINGEWHQVVEDVHTGKTYVDYTQDKKENEKERHRIETEKNREKALKNGEKYYFPSNDLNTPRSDIPICIKDDKPYIIIFKNHKKWLVHPTLYGYSVCKFDITLGTEYIRELSDEEYQELSYDNIRRDYEIHLNKVLNRRNVTWEDRDEDAEYR